MKKYLFLIPVILVLTSCGEIEDGENYKKIIDSVQLRIDAVKGQNPLYIDASVWVEKGDLSLVDEFGILWSPNKISSIGNEFYTIPGTGNGNTFSASFTPIDEIITSELYISKTVYLSPYIRINDKYFAYEEKTIEIFTSVKDILPAIDISSPAVSGSRATFHAGVTDPTGTGITERGFLWARGNTRPNFEDNIITAGNGEGTFSATEEFTPGNYAVCAYARNSYGTFISAGKTFVVRIE